MSDQPKHPDKDPNSNKYVIESQLRGTEFSEKRKRRIDEAKQHAKDKEIFDITKLANFLSLNRSDGKPGDISPEVIEEFEADYYINNPGVKTLQEFATEKQKQESHESSS